jgi:predicted phosphate transport protein (TIGR00153 family)
MGLKEWLLPPEREFFDLLDKQAGFVLEGAHALRDLLKDFRDVGAKRKHIKDIEHKGDETVHTIYEELNKTFITPIDREDITALASDLDNVLDQIDAVAIRLDLFEIAEPSRAMLDFAEVIVEAAAALQKAVGMIRDMKNAELVEKICVEVNRLENVGDDLLNTSVAALFHDLDVVQILKNKEILERLESATDYCEDVANVLSDIVAKNR